MKKYFFMIVFLLIMGMVADADDLSTAQGNGFVYRDNGRRDPFWPLVSPSGAILIYDANVAFADMILEGIIYDPKGEKLAIINTKVVKINDQVGGFLVVAIEPDRVFLSKDGQTFILRPKKEK